MLREPTNHAPAPLPVDEALATLAHELRDPLRDDSTPRQPDESSGAGRG